MPATPLYKSIVERIRQAAFERGLTMCYLDDRAGVQDGYTAKVLHPDTPSGRTARWDTLQFILDATFPGGVDVMLIPRRFHPPARHRWPESEQLDMFDQLGV